MRWARCFLFSFDKDCDILLFNHPRAGVAAQTGRNARTIKPEAWKERTHLAIWNREIECAKRSDIERIQLERLQQTVRRAYDHVPMYRDKMISAGVKPSDIRTLKDIAKIPLTSKTELREQYPFKLLAVPMRDIVRIHASSGTTGQPITAGYTRGDLELWAECIARIVTAGGVTAAIDFIYAIITVLRRQGDVMRLYLIAFAASAVLPFVLVRVIGLTGAVASYLAVMALLLGLLIWQYARIRREIDRSRDPFA